MVRETWWRVKRGRRVVMVGGLVKMLVSRMER
jgi:hypothetical protein